MTFAECPDIDPTPVLPVRITSMPDRDYIDHRIILENAVDDPIVADAYAKQIVRSVEFARSRRSGVFSEALDPGKYASRHLDRDTRNLAPRRTRQNDLVEQDQSPSTFRFASRSASLGSSARSRATTES